MPKALQRWATSAPTRPRPTMPRVLPYSSVPWKRLRCQRPSRRAAWAWGMLRAWARIRATVCSAAEITFDWGALTTMIPSRVAAATSTLSRPMPARPTTLRSRPVSSTSASTRVADRTTRASTPATALSSSSRVMAVRASTSWVEASSSTPASASGSVSRTRATGSLLPLVPQPGHHPAQGLAGLLDRVVGPGLAHAGEVGPALVVLVDPFAGEGPGLDLGQDAAHLGLDPVVDDAGAAGVVAVLGRVRHRVAHAGQAALVHQVDDQLELVQALEVGDLGLVAGLGQGLEAGLDERGGAAAEDGLLAEQVGLGLLLEGGDQGPGPGPADRPGVALGQVPGLAGGVLGDRDQHRGALAVLELAPDQVAGALGGDHGHVHGLGHLDVAEVDVEAVGEEQGVAGAEVGGDVASVQVPLHGVGDQHHDQVGPGRRLGRAGHGQPGRLGLGPAGRALGQPDPDLAARVVQREGVGVALGAVAEHGDLAGLDQAEVGVVVVVDGGHLWGASFRELFASGGSGHPQRLVGDALAAAGQGDPAGAGQLADAVGVEQLEHGLDLGRAAGGLDGEGLGADVDDLGPEHLGQLDDLVADRRVGLDLDQDQLALDGPVRLQLDDLEHVDQLIELLGDLLEGPLGAVDHDRHAAAARVLGGADGQAVDVEAAPAEQPRDAGQDPGLVLDQDRDGVGAHQARTSRRVAAACSSGLNSGPRMISSLGRPAATIGKTPSWVSTRKSTTTDWSSVASAFSRVASTSSARSQRRPSAP